MEDIVPKTLTKNKILKHLNTLYMKTVKFYLNIDKYMHKYSFSQGKLWLKCFNFLCIYINLNHIIIYNSDYIISTDMPYYHILIHNSGKYINVYIYYIIK